MRGDKTGWFGASNTAEEDLFLAALALEQGLKEEKTQQGRCQESRSGIIANTSQTAKTVTFRNI